MNSSKKQGAARANAASTRVTDAKDTYNTALAKIMIEILAAFKCDHHNGRLYKKIRGSIDYIRYSNKHLVEHAKLIIS